MSFLKNLVIVGLVTACAAPAALAQGSSRANATSTTFSVTTPSFNPINDTVINLSSLSREVVSSSFYGSALLKAERGHMAQARADMYKAIKADRSNIVARVDYAFMVLQDERPEQAKAQIEKAEELLSSCDAEQAQLCNSLRGKVAQFDVVYRQASFN